MVIGQLILPPRQEATTLRGIKSVVTPPISPSGILMYQVGEGFVRELDFGRIWLRINADADDGGEDIVAEFKCDTRDFLEQCLVR